MSTEVHSERVACYKYICLNPACTHRSHQLIKKFESQEQAPEPCEVCEQPMKLVGEVAYGGIGGKYRQGSIADKRDLMLKRSSEHFKKSGLADRKKYLNNELKQQAREHFKR